MAAELAQTLGITIHSIGMGTLAAEAPVPVQSPFGDTRITNMPVDIDEPTLQSISAKTGGLYFRATDNSVLEYIYKEIDKLEKTRLKTRNYQSVGEDFPIFVLFGILSLLIEFILRHTLLRTTP